MEEWQEEVKKGQEEVKVESRMGESKGQGQGKMQSRGISASTAGILLEFQFEDIYTGCLENIAKIQFEEICTGCLENIAKFQFEDICTGCSENIIARFFKFSEL